LPETHGGVDVPRELFQESDVAYLSVGKDRLNHPCHQRRLLSLRQTLECRHRCCQDGGIDICAQAVLTHVLLPSPRR
jgi:hypothetical protein